MSGRPAKPSPGSGETLRENVAWLMYCLDQGYVNAADREILDNWLLEDVTQLHPDDAARRPHLLAMADEVIAAVRGDADEMTDFTPQATP